MVNSNTLIAFGNEHQWLCKSIFTAHKTLYLAGPPNIDYDLAAIDIQFGRRRWIMIVISLWFSALGVTVMNPG